MTDPGRVGKTLASKYRLDEELGRGGMGAVYRAFHVLVRKEFAVKVLNDELAGHKKVAQRFFLEAQAAGRIGHPGILEVYDVGEDEDGRPFMVMELLRGEPLAALVSRGPLGVDEACWIAMQVLDVLAAAHAADVVHRDVKPQNVFLVAQPDGTRTVKLLDFGIAKFAAEGTGALTKSGEIIGSPLYMAPEQAKGEPDVDARVDVWSVGAMLFEMLVGAPAHAAATPVAVLARILTEKAPLPSSRRSGVSSELDAVLERALSIDRGARFSGASEMLDALRAVRTLAGTADVVPNFGPPPALVRVGEARDARAGVETSTIVSDVPSAGAAAPERDVRASKEPPMEAAVTNQDGGRSAARPRSLVAVALVAVVVGGAVATVRSIMRSADASPPASSAATGTMPSATASAAASASASALPRASTSASTSAPASASASAPEPRSLVTRAGAAVGADAGVTPAVSRPACAAGEVLSSGHCCPRGLVWQAGRCERPLATSF